MQREAERESVQDDDDAGIGGGGYSGGDNPDKGYGATAGETDSGDYE